MLAFPPDNAMLFLTPRKVQAAQAETFEHLLEATQGVGSINHLICTSHVQLVSGTNFWTK